jgi:hypothetical protein
MAASTLWAAPAVERVQIGVSGSGLPVEVLALGDEALDAHGRSRDQRPALLIVAGLQGHHAVGTATARAVADRLVRDHAGLLADRTVYILAEANPDGAARWRAGSPYRAESGRVPLVGDADRDGRTGEDTPNDLNGDGAITMMRVPAPNHRYGLQATHIIDPDDGRLLKEPKAGEGAATHALLIEGVDDDGDGAFNEDGWGGASGGGVDLDKHFPIHWPEHTDGAGLYPLERPEARALVEWAQARTNITAVLVYGPHDSLTAVPPVGKNGPEGKVPTGIEEGDKVFYEKVSESFKAITGIEKVPDSPDRAGSFLQWAYADLGVFAFGTPVWVRPDLVKSDGKAGAEGTDGKEEAAPDSGGDALAALIAADRAALAEKGVPADLIEFLYMTPDERVAEMAAFDQRSAQEQQATMAAMRNLPMDIQQRLMAVAQGNPDPGAPVVPAAEPIPAAEKPAEAAKPAKKAGDSAEAKWLTWFEDQGVAGFVEWTAFEHPQLGPVEIGGFVPGARISPLESLMDGLAEQQTRFAADLLGRLPALEVDAAVVESIGGGLWRVSVTLRNTGMLPTAAAIGVKARRVPGPVVAFDPARTVPDERLVAGRRVQRVEVLAGSGGSQTFEWVVAAEAGSEARLEVRTGVFGSRGLDVRFESFDGGAQ